MRRITGRATRCASCLAIILRCFNNGLVENKVGLKAAVRKALGMSAPKSFQDSQLGSRSFRHPRSTQTRPTSCLFLSRARRSDRGEIKLAGAAKTGST